MAKYDTFKVSLCYDFKHQSDQTVTSALPVKPAPPGSHEVCLHLLSIHSCHVGSGSVQSEPLYHGREAFAARSALFFILHYFIHAKAETSDGISFVLIDIITQSYEDM